MKTLRQLYLESIDEATNASQASELIDDVDKINQIDDVDFDKSKNQLIIKYKTDSGKKVKLIVAYDKFLDWFLKNINDMSDIFMSFADDFLKNSKSKDVDNMQEIVDLYGNIMGDDDTPSNSTNRMVGSSNRDTETIYNQSIQKKLRMYTGDLGAGAVVY